MRAEGVAEGEGERSARSDDGPVGSGVQAVAPGVGARYLAAIKMGYRRVEFRRRKLLLRGPLGLRADSRRGYGGSRRSSRSEARGRATYFAGELAACPLAHIFAHLWARSLL